MRLPRQTPRADVRVRTAEKSLIGNTEAEKIIYVVKCKLMRWRSGRANNHPENHENGRVELRESSIRVFS